jgi:hypothetical protein
MLRKTLTFLTICFGSLFLGMLFVLIFVNATEVNCRLQPDRSYTCQTRTLLLGKVQTFTGRIEHVVDITMQRDSCDDGCAYRAEFVSAEGRQEPLSQVYTDQAPVLQQVNTIRAQMNSHAEQISYKSDPPWWVLFLVGGLTLMAMLLSPLTFLRDR